MPDQRKSRQALLHLPNRAPSRLTKPCRTFPAPPDQASPDLARPFLACLALPCQAKPYRAFPATPRLALLNLTRPNLPRHAVTSQALPYRAKPSHTVPFLPCFTTPRLTLPDLTCRQDFTANSSPSSVTSSNVPQPHPAELLESGRPSQTPTCAPTRARRFRTSSAVN